VTSRCQCRVRDAINQRPVEGGVGSSPDPRLLQDFEAGAADADWRVREFYASHLNSRGVRRDPADAPRWGTIERALLADPAKQVRMAAASQLRATLVREQMRAWRPGRGTGDFADQLRADQEQVRTLPLAAELDEWRVAHPDPLGDMERRGGPPPDIAERPLYNDRRWAAHNYAEAGPLLADDPVCEVRADAVGQVLAHGSDQDLASRARKDPCPRVRAAVIRALGDREVADAGSLTQRELLAAAAVTETAERLAELAGHPDDRIRAVVAANRACPGGLLTALYGDPVWEVWTAAKNNSSWPNGVWLVDALADHDLDQPLDPDRLAAAVLHTRTPVRCAVGRSRVYAGAGYINPRADAPWLCDRDAVVLHSWGPFCWEHQQEVDECRQSGGSDGYVAQRLRSGLWVRLGQGGPAGPLPELWSGPW
jgi:hypothetical protein